MNENDNKVRTKLTKGGKNLMILGILAIVMAAITTGVSLVVYHNSGDIYLDRSRPGFLPDEEEIRQDELTIEDYNFDKTGKISEEILEEYLVEIQKEVEVINSFKDPFNMDVLSDENLGI